MLSVPLPAAPVHPWGPNRPKAYQVSGVRSRSPDGTRPTYALLVDNRNEGSEFRPLQGCGLRYWGHAEFQEARCDR